MAETNVPATQSSRPPVVVHDNSEFSSLLDTAKFDHMWRVASLFSKSELVPTHYRGKPENALLALQMAFRLQIDPLMLMQNTYIVQGRPGMESKLIIALINSSGIFTGPLQFKLEGSGKTRSCAAFATHAKSGERCEANVDMSMAEAEGWVSKSGSKWKTMPDLMLRYRAAAFFGRLYCPERLLGMQTVEELNDIAAPPTSESKADDLMNRFADPDAVIPAPAESAEVPMSEEEKAEIIAEEQALFREPGCDDA